MNDKHRTALGAGFLAVVFLAAGHAPSPLAWAACGGGTGNSQVFTDFRGEKPGTVHKITVADLPAPYATRSADPGSEIIPRPANAWPQAPEGFKVQQFAGSLDNPRLIRTAPNGDVFVAESSPGRIKVYRGISKNGEAASVHDFTSGLTLPFGIAFYPPGPDPNYMYIADTDSVVRFPYKNGDLEASGPKQVIVPNLPGFGRLRGGGHWTRDIAFSPDGKRMFVSVGSHSNVDDPDTTPAEFHRADILVANPDGTDLRVYAWGIRNPVGLAVSPQTGELWASVNERDLTGRQPSPGLHHARAGGWFLRLAVVLHRLAPGPTPCGKASGVARQGDCAGRALGAAQRLAGAYILRGRAIPGGVSRVIFSRRSTGRGTASVRTGYEVIRVPLKDGRATGEYEDFLDRICDRRWRRLGTPGGCGRRA